MFFHTELTKPILLVIYCNTVPTLTVSCSNTRNIITHCSCCCVDVCMYKCVVLIVWWWWYTTQITWPWDSIYDVIIDTSEYICDDMMEIMYYTSNHNNTHTCTTPILLYSTTNTPLTNQSNGISIYFITLFVSLTTYKRPFHQHWWDT